MFGYATNEWDKEVTYAEEVDFTQKEFFEMWKEYKKQHNQKEYYKQYYQQKKIKNKSAIIIQRFFKKYFK
jgi:hypothetical protein